jgi:XTP/dITP diphosphohydrolase
LHRQTRGKLKEFDELCQTTFSPLRLLVLPITNFSERFNVEETGNTFAANARLKAEAALALSGLPSLGDDSGLCVDALDGEPGLRSARWLGDLATDHDRNVGLLERLKDVPVSSRTAYFECTLCIAFPDGASVQGVGRCYGRITFEEAGTDGFGYDPIFQLPEFEATFAQLTLQQKNRISHRTKAMQDLKGNLIDQQYVCLK